MPLPDPLGAWWAYSSLGHMGLLMLAIFAAFTTQPAGGHGPGSWPHGLITSLLFLSGCGH